MTDNIFTVDVSEDPMLELVGSERADTVNRSGENLK